MPRDTQAELEALCYKGNGVDDMTDAFEMNTAATRPFASKAFNIRGGLGVEQTELQWVVAQYGGLFVVDGMIFTGFHCGSYSGQKRANAMDYVVVGGKKANK